MKNYAALIYNYYNVLEKVEVRTSWKLANRAGKFFTKNHQGWWYRTTALFPGELEMYKSMINA